MTDDYLWDRSGTPDPDVAALEASLAVLAHRPAPLGLPARPVRSSAALRRHIITGLSLAATVALVVASALFRHEASRPASWEVAALTGEPRVNDRPIGEEGRWRAGEQLRTGDADAAQVTVGSIGSVEIGPNSIALLERSRPSEHRIALERGRLSALIWAPPGLFYVDTPSAEAIDLGCAYTLEVAPDGSGVLRVQSGWVGFRDEGRESFIPQGAMCATRRGRGPGTPHYEDAAESLVSALAAFDFGSGAERREGLANALAAARPQDAISVWHMLARTDGEERGRVFDRLAELAPPPATVTRDGIVRGDRAMTDAWWDTLGVESASWWRMWETPWKR